MKLARSIRLAKGLSIWEVSRRTGIDPSRLSKFERDLHRNMRYEDLRALAKCLEVDIETLLVQVVPSTNGKRGGE